MQFLVSVIEEFLPGGVRENPHGSATPDEAEAIDAFNARLQAEGYWVFAGGLASPDAAELIDARAGEGVVQSGPLGDSIEGAGGLWILEVPDLEAARALGIDASRACNRRIEVRPFLPLPDGA